ncbi:MAG: MarR family transcriptional regulator [Methanocorpusculum sp.]|nr:MarR family transcriptional regulator [Methanocorpusculum sp.]
MQELEGNHELTLYLHDGQIVTVRNPIRIQILNLVRDEGEVPFSRLLEVTGLSKSTVSGYINSLTSAGLIRQVPCPSDARRKIYTLSSVYVGSVAPSTYAAASEFRDLIRHTYTSYNTINYRDMIPHIFRVALAESGIRIDPVLRRGGIILGEAIAPYVVADTLEKTVSNIEEFWAHYEFGEVRVRSLSPLRLDVYKCYECMTLPKGMAGGCIISKGILSALFTAFYHEEVRVEEIECMTQGYPCCCFEVGDSLAVRG